MKILLINWQDRKNPLSGGAEIHIHEIFGRIAKWGSEVTLFCSSFEGAKEREYVDGMEVIRRGKRYNFNFYVPFVLRGLLRDNYDIVVDNINKIPFFTPLYVKTPILAIGYHFFGPIIYRETNPLFASYVYLTERLVPKIYKKEVFSVISESTKQDLKGIPENNIYVISPAISPEFIPASNKKSDKPLIIHIGRIKKYKRLDILLYAMKEIIERIPDARLIVAGTGDYLPYLISLSKKLKIERCVEFTGFVAEEKKIEFLQSASVLVNPSPKEGWGITSIEANACGTPVVASDSPGLRDSVVDGKTGFLVKHGSVEDLSHRIIQILRNDSLRNTLSRDAIEWASKFSWDDAAQKTLSVIQSIVEKNLP
ncbi:glycosyltransferase family 4 protein [candidate division WOR-3 bacterium]|nr:glycosyltransferase family 4 protein [candidate division WOR-3 bacterium]